MQHRQALGKKAGRLARLSAALLLMVTLSACLPVTPRAASPTAAEPVELLVFAAASLTDAFQEIAAAFEATTPGVTVIVNYGGSSGLAAQLMEGSVADLFASANAAQMQKVVDAGLVSAPPQIFATNQLVVIVPADNPAAVTTLADLAQPGLKLILAVPGVPVRDYTDQMISALAADPAYGAAYAAAFYANLVSEEENVRQVAAKIALGEADAGVVYASDVTPDLASRVSQIPIPAEVNIIAAYPIAVLHQAPHPELAQAFVDFVASGAGQAILQRWGLGAAPQ